MSASPEPTYEFDDYRLNPARRLLWRCGELVQLTPRVFDTLLFMVEHPETVLDKERIMEAVWPDSIVEENNLTQNVSTLRRVFGETPGSHRYIVTVPGRGYRFVANVRAGEASSLLDSKLVTPGPVQESAAVIPVNHQSFIRNGSTRKSNFATRMGLLLAGSMIVAGVFVFGIRRTSTPIATSPKSIAVLPFESLSTNPENTYLASGIQDEILSNLAKIANLKVISRTSASLYKTGSPRNAREIGQQLGVSRLLEGSVQRSGDHLRVHAQLIDTKNDSHLWAQTYDRDFADVFAIQREIAQTIANQLQIRISEQESASIAEPLTHDLVANNLYSEALALEPLEPSYENRLKALGLLEQAVARDPRFVMAYCALARMNLSLHLYGQKQTAGRLQMAEAALQKATNLQPNSGEVHLARAHYLAFGLRDYDRARIELDFAQRSLPNNEEVYRQTALIDRRQGRWTEAVRNFDRALELDPKNPDILGDAASTYEGVFRYAEASQLARRLLVVRPRDYWGRVFVAVQRLHEYADVRPMRAELNAILAEEPDAAPKILADLFRCAVLERNAAALDQVLTLIPPEGIADLPGVFLPREWYEGYAAHISNRPDIAGPAFEKASTTLKRLVNEQPENALAWSSLGMSEASLGHREDAIRNGRRACEILPVSREATSGRRPRKALAAIYAIVGEKDLAIEELAQSVVQPMGQSYGELKLDPAWDSLRGDPRFEKILASLAPKKNSPN